MNVAPNAIVTLTFSEPLDPASVTGSTVTVSHGTAAVTYLSASNAIRLTLSGQSTTTDVVVTATTGVRDVAGNALASEYSLTYRTGSDVTRPTVLSTVPTQSATGVMVNSNVIITFSEPLDPATVSASTVSISNGAAIVSYVSASNAIQLSLTGQASNTLTTVTVTTGVRDVAGNALLTNFTLSYRTALDTTRPTVISTVPANGATSVSPNTTVLVAFDEPLNPAFVTTSNVTVSNGTATVSYLSASNSIQVALTGQSSLSTVTVTVRTGIRDTAGNALASNYVFSYSTGADTTPPTVLSTTPLGGSTNSAPNSNVIFTMSEDIDPATVTATNVTISHGTGTVGWLASNRWIHVFGITGQAYGAPVTVTLGTGIRDVAGNALAAPYVLSYTTMTDTTAPTVSSVTPAQGATYVPPSTSVSIRFSEPMDPATINATNITVDGMAPTVTYGSFNTASVYLPTWSWPQSTVVTVRVSTNVRDAQGNALAAPYVLTFTTGETSPPYVLSSLPASGATDVPPASTINITFNEVLDPATVTTANLFLDGLSSTVSWDGPSRTATLTPTAPMPTGNVTARVTTGVRDPSGNPMWSPFSVTFAVSPVDTTPPRVITTLPNVTSENVPLDTTVRITFSEDLNAGTVLSSNLYLDGVMAGVSWNAGTRTATLTPVANLPPDTVITGHVTTGVRDLAGIAMATQYDFSFRSKDPGPPRVVSTSPANGATGVSRTGALDITFNERLTASTVNTGNFFCDVPTTLSPYLLGTFTVSLRPQHPNGWPNASVVTCHVGTGVRDLDDLPMTAPYDFSFTIPDTQPPLVQARVPASGATGVSITSTVSAQFDEALNPASVTTAGFFVQGRTGTVAYDAPTRTVTWTDSAPFANSTVYVVRVTNSLRDPAGNGAVTTSWNFTTEPDTTPPTVTSTVPANNSVGVLQTLGRMRANFSEPLNPSTVNGSTVSCTRTVGTVTTAEPGTAGYNATQRAAYFVPTAPFVYGARYTCTLGTGVTDVVGNALLAPVTFTFTVEADSYPPRIATSNPTQYGHFFPVASPLTVTFDEDVQAATVNATNLQVNGVTSTVSYNAGTRTATVTPSAPLTGDRGYVLTVNGVRDTGNRPITVPITIEFRTTPTTQRVSGVTSPSFAANRVVQLTNGVLHLTRVWNGGNEHRLQWAYLSGGVWTNGDLGECSSAPDLWTAPYGTNRAGVAWRTNTGRVFASFDGTTWTATTTIEDDFGTVMAGGDVLGFLSSAASGGVEVQFFDGAAWGAVTQLSTQGQPNSLAHNGTDWVAVYRYATGTIGDWHVYARVLSGGTWGSASDLITFPRPSTSAPKWAVAANPSGFAVAFVDRGQGYCAVRFHGVWQTRVTNGFTGGRNDWFELAANGTGYAWVYTVGSGVWDLHYRIWDGGTQTWSAQPTQGVPFTAYLGRGRGMALTSSGPDYFVAQELETSGVKGHRFTAGAWTSTTFPTTGLSPVGPMAVANGRVAISWNDATQWWSSIYTTAWQAPERVDTAGLLSSLALAKNGTTLQAFIHEGDDIRYRTSPSGGSFGVPLSIPNVGLNGPATTPVMAFADDGRGLAVWEQYDAGVRRILARYFNGSAWTGAAFRVSTTPGIKPRVATNGTRWVISWLEPAGSSQHAWRASWVLAGGLTAPVKENTTLNGFDTAVASSDGSFLMTWMEDRNIYAKHSADGVTFGSRETVGANADIAASLKLLALPGLYVSGFGELFGNTVTNERGSSAGGTWSSATSRSGNCSLARMETTWGGACAPRSGSGAVTGFVAMLPSTTFVPSGFTGSALAVGGQGERLRATWATNARDWEPVFEWAPPLVLPATMVAVADDSIHFFGLAPGAGGVGLGAFVESASTGFSLQQAFDSTANVVGTPSLSRGRGELGALWTRPAATVGRDEVWGTVF